MSGTNIKSGANTNLIPCHAYFLVICLKFRFEFEFYIAYNIVYTQKQTIGVEFHSAS